MPWYVSLPLNLALIIGSFVIGVYLAQMLRMRDYGWKIGLILCTTVIATVITVTKWPPKLGIDLSGGVILVYEVDQSKKTDPSQTLTSDQMEKLVTAVTRRVNPGGQKKVTIRPYGAEAIEIIIPEVGGEEAKRIERLVSRTGTLAFRTLASDRNDKAVIDQALRENSRQVKDPEGNLLAWWVPMALGETPEDRERVQGVLSYPEIAKQTIKRGGQEVHEVLVLKDTFDVTGAYLVQARPDVDNRTGRPCVTFIFNSTGGQLFGGLTGNNLPDPVQKNVTRKLGIILDEYLYSAPSIQSTIYERGEITGSFTKAEVQDLVNVLNAGSLPTSLTEKPVSRLESGPTLGRDTIRRSAHAMILSSILVPLFMLWYYRFSGVVANIALALNMLMLVGIMMMIKAAFTLPGLAGLALTVGMAVDNNVLIYERLREEMERGATLRMAIRNAFHRAGAVIIDTNTTHVIAATVLWVVGTERVKGFAVTLWLGAAISLFTSVFVARVIFEIAERQRWISTLKMFKVIGHTNIDFMGLLPVTASISVLVIAMGLLVTAIRGPGILDIDFTGGVSVEAMLRQAKDPEEVRSALRDLLPDVAVNDVRIEGELEGMRYKIDTSEKDFRTVQADLKEVFPDDLVSNSVTFTSPTLITPAKPAAEQPAPQKPAEPKAKEQTRNDLPADNVLAWGGPTPLLLAEASSPEPAAMGTEAAERATETPEKAPAETPPTPAETPPATPAETPPAAPTETPPAAPTETPPAAPTETPPAAPAETPPATPAETSAKATEAPTAPPETPAKAAEVPTVPKEGPAEKAPAATEPAAADAFVGGAQTTLTFTEKLNHKMLEEMLTRAIETSKVATEAVPFELSAADYAEGDTTPYSSWTVKIQLPPERAEKVFTGMQQELAATPFFPASNVIGGAVASNTRVLAVYAVVSSWLLIILYLWIRFQKVAFGVAAVIALVHDVLIMLAGIAASHYIAQIPFLGFLGIDQFKINLPIIAATLLIIGYSVNDTIVIFDRIREIRGKAPRITSQIVNDATNQTLSRTLLTSFTVFLVVIILYMFGGQALHGFAFALFVGVVTGTYSSIYVAAPILLWLSGSSIRVGRDRRDIPAQTSRAAGV